MKKYNWMAIREAARERGFKTDRELAEASAVSATSICELIYGKRRNPTVELLSLLADALGMKVWELIKMCDEDVADDNT